MKRFLAGLFALACILALIAAAAVGWVIHKYGSDLPDYAQLADYEPPITTRVYAGDGRLFAEFAVQRRVFVPIEAIPERVQQAFISAEDKTFFTHPGIDVFGIARAAVTNLRNMGSDRRLVGASTITQQVAKNFLIGNEVSMGRKIKEAILAFRIEQTYSKEKILELYLNEIYLGRGSYGVIAAALNYFNKSLDELSIAEVAFLAALPKAPNNYDPIRHPEAARGRRDWVIGRMLEDGSITREEYETAVAAPIVLHQLVDAETVHAEHFAEEVRREIAQHYGEKALYEGGLVVRSSLDPRLQEIAERELRRGLIAYDRRHGWRGPMGRLDGAGAGTVPEDWRARLAKVETGPDLPPWDLAVVLTVDSAGAGIGLADGRRGVVPFAELKWARPWRKNQRVGAPPRQSSDVLSVGDMIAVEAVTNNDDGNPYPAQTYALRQIPDVEGAIVVLDPHTGRVLAMTGGYSYKRSEFNRATQAMRQPGSAFKPFVYLTALQNGYVPTQLIVDAPIVIDQGPGLPLWRPHNYSNKFYGPTTMRRGLEKSRNLMTVRLAQAVGMERVVDTAIRFGVFDSLPPHLSYALGAGETTLLRLTTAYAMLVNGGKKLTPTLIDRIQDRHGRTIFRHDQRPCDGCAGSASSERSVPQIPDDRESVTDPDSAYQIVSMMEGVVQRGTGVRVKAVGRPIAGKTGTTNDSKDTWFLGFTPDLAAGVFVGFDDPRTLGPRETGSSAAAPIFRDFMKAALADEPATPFRVPSGIRLVRVSLQTGRRVSGSGAGVILEACKPDTACGQGGGILRGVSAASDGPSVGTGGLY